MHFNLEVVNVWMAKVKVTFIWVAVWKVGLYWSSSVRMLLEVFKTLFDLGQNWCGSVGTRLKYVRSYSAWFASAIISNLINTPLKCRYKRTFFLVAQVSANLPPLMRRLPSTRTLAPPSTAWGTSSARTTTGRTCAWWASLFSKDHWFVGCCLFFYLFFVFLSCQKDNLSVFVSPGCPASGQRYSEEPEACCGQKEAHQGCQDRIKWNSWKINKIFIFGEKKKNIVRNLNYICFRAGI